MHDLDYWREHVSLGAEECGLTLTAAQRDSIAESVQGGHEHYELGSPTPSANDLLSDINRQWQARYDRLQAEFDRYKGNAEKAVGQALNVHHQTRVSIGEYGEVLAHGGRTQRIQ